jgi:hypothetical protein
MGEDSDAKSKKKECFCALSSSRVAFLNAGAQKEWALAQQNHSAGKTPLAADLVFLRLGEVQLFVDARVADSTQPTRSLGDLIAPARPLRYAQVMYAPALKKDRRILLLTSDGPFANGAFANLDALVRCVQDPLAYVREEFYRAGQELTERLRLAGILEPAQAALAASSTTWPSFVQFLDTHHMPTAHHEALANTYMHTTSDELARWRVAAHEASHWLRTHTAQSACTRGGDCHLHAHVAARLAVLMGSTDNITLHLC